MNTNDLPPAARLAALIEAGRAAHPEMTQSFGRMHDGAGKGSACAIGFACLGSGMTVKQVRNVPGLAGAADALCVPKFLCFDVAGRNDYRGDSLDKIILSLREGDLAKVPA